MCQKVKQFKRYKWNWRL